MDNEIMSSVPNFSSSSPILIVLDMDHLVEEILSHLQVSDLELLRYRLVSRKWNDIIVRKNTKSRDFFQVKLRYGHGIPRFINQSDAQRWACEILESSTRALTSAAATTVSKLPVDSLLIDRDFFLAGLLPQWTSFLKVYGKTIRHLKIDIRSEKFPGRYVNYVSDCDVVVSLECLRALFYAVPNLESLNFGIRFSHYGYGGTKLNPFVNLMFPNFVEAPKLPKLTKISIGVPYDGFYSVRFVKEILSMAPNLSSLYLKLPACNAKPVTTAINELGILPSLRTLGISHVCGDYLGHIHSLIHYGLNTLEINSIYSSGSGSDDNTRGGVWIESSLRSLHATLVKVILGNRNRDGPGGGPLIRFIGCPIHFRNAMESLKSLEVNLTKFKLSPIQSYQTEFPILENLTFTNFEVKENIWSYSRLSHLLPGNSGKSETVKNFSLLGPITDSQDEKDKINQAARATFPTANLFFGL